MSEVDVPMADSVRTAHTLRLDLVIGDPTDEGKVMISDPRNNRHYLVSVTTMSVLSCFDGTRTNPEIHAALAADGIDVSDETLTSMTAKAGSLGFFEGQAGAPGPVAAHLRGPSRRSIVFFNVAEFDPSRAVAALRPLGRLLFSKGAVLVLLALFGWSVLVMGQNSTRYVVDLGSFATFPAWGLVYIGNAVVTLFHEFGHAVAVTRFGGAVNRMGLAFYLFSPAAYTDISSAWAFPRTGHRVIVSAAGIYVESFVLALGILVWGADVLPAVPSAAVFILCHTLLARIVLNLNPFLRLDGYWMLSDVLKIPNMRPKAFVVLLASISPFRKDRRSLAFVQSGEERLLLLFYAMLSLVALVVGLVGGFILLDQIVRRYVTGYGDTASRIAALVIAVAVIASGSRYVRTLRNATFVGGGRRVD